jgi:arylsulfatase A-like enzyme
MVSMADGRKDPMAQRPPNILLIQSDQHRYDCLSANGHPLLQTPHLDRLAAEGVRFSHAFTPIPVCVPARNSLMHGNWPTDHLAIANKGTEAPRPARDGLPAFTRVLRDAGYVLGHVGKWQVHPDRGPQAYGFHERIPVAGYETWRAGRGHPPTPREQGWFGELDPHIGPEDTRLAWGADQVIRLLERRATGDAPFFLQWDTNEPHLPNVLPEPFYSMYPPESIAPWPSFPDPLTGKPYIQGQQRRTWQIEGWTWREWAPVVSRYMGTVSLLDAQVGRLLGALDRLGLTQNTVVIYSTDHGDMCGGHGMVDKHMVMYDDILHVPLIVRWPGHATPGTTCDAFVSHAIDLATTFCALAGAQAPETFCGASLLPLLSGEGDNKRQDILSMYHGNQFGLYSERALRDRRYKYVWNAAAEDELYDLALDPGELRNLATDPAYRHELDRLRHRLVAWMESIRDPLLNSWTRKQLIEGLSI